MPARSFKFAAGQQKAQTCDALVLARIESQAGHGAGKPTGMQIAYATDYLSFLVKSLGVASSAQGGAGAAK